MSHSRTTPEHHPPDEDLAAWLEDPSFLAHGRSAEIEAHTSTCERCQRLLAELAGVEQGLQALRESRPMPPANFTARVQASLPGGLYTPAPAAAPARPQTRAAWLRGQMASLALMLAGLVAIVLSGDTLLVALGWWQDAGSWLGSVSTENTTWLSAAPGGALESHLGLLPGVILLGAGALIFLAFSLRGAAPAVQHRRPGVHANLP